MTVLPSVGGILVDGVVMGGAIGPYLVGLGVSINIGNVGIFLISHNRVHIYSNIS